MDGCPHIDVGRGRVRREARSELKRAAVIGAGTMGSGIASHLANAGVRVLLLDVVPPGAVDRDVIAKGALERARRATPPAFVHEERAALVETGNIEDHLHRVEEADWIAEAVVERLEVKQALYRRLDALRRPGSMVSSNTSTIPLAMLTEGLSEAFKRDFCITHFFNPVRYMRLLEVVAGPSTRPEVVETLSRFGDEHLGKGVVQCRDTPGFLGNRVGVFAIQTGILEAHALGLDVEEADGVMGRPMGFPKTGVFGVYDLIGLDLMLDVVKSLVEALPPGDEFQRVAGGVPIIADLVSRGFTGNKGRGGFYREREAEGGSEREAVDLDTGVYRTRRRFDAGALEGQGLRALVERPDRLGRFAWRVLSRTLSYAASLVPEVSPDPTRIDEAMRLGFNWTKGPFEMIDELGGAWFRARLEEEGAAVPALLAAAGDSPLYRSGRDGLHYLGVDGAYRAVPRPPGVLRLSDLTRSAEPLLRNKAASLWEVGDGVVCAEFRTKANTLVPASMNLLREAAGFAAERGRALLVHTDAPHFSMGVNLAFILDAAREGRWGAIDRMLIEFQDTCTALRDAPVPVVAAPAGMALGGGFEVVMHCDAVQANVNCTFGLVETLVGLVPGGGGCKEVLRRWTSPADADPVAGARRAFEYIGMGKTASSPAEALPMRFLRAHDRSTMNRDRLLAEAKSFALALAEGYSPPGPPDLRAVGAPGRDAMRALLERLRAKGVAAAHDEVVGTELAAVLSGGSRAAGEALGEAEVHALEREAFLRLVRTGATQARIEHLLATGRPLRN